MNVCSGHSAGVSFSDKAGKDIPFLRLGTYKCLSFVICS